MSNIRQFLSKEDIQEQACLWISRLDRGLSDAEKAELEAWLGDSQSHRAALLEAASLWDDMSALNELSGLFPQYQTKSDVTQLAHRKSKRVVWSSIAACFTLVMCWALFTQTHFMNKPNVVASVTQNVSTGIGEQKNIVLSDGSTLHINTNSVVSIDFSQTLRHIVLLKGEAHFQVAHEVDRPFVVTAGSNTVTAVGTAFNMQYVEDGAFELVVTEGKVLVKDRFTTFDTPAAQLASQVITEQGLLMFAGEKATVQGDVDGRENLSQNDIDDDLAWQQGMIVFKGEPLEEVLFEIGRYTPVRLAIVDDSLKGRRVAGFFKVGDIDGLLSALETSFDISSEQVSENRIHLSASTTERQ